MAAITQQRVRRIVLGIGALLAVYAAARWWHGQRAFARMQPTTCRLVIKAVEPKLLVRQRGSGRLTGSKARLRYRDEGRLVFAHTLDGQKYTFREDFHADEMPLEDYEEGRTYPCRYDPHDPSRATITTAFDREEVDVVFILAGFTIVIGFMTPQIWRQAVEGAAAMRNR